MIEENGLKFNLWKRDDLGPDDVSAAGGTTFDFAEKEAWLLATVRGRSVRLYFNDRPTIIDPELDHAVARVKIARKVQDEFRQQEQIRQNAERDLRSVDEYIERLSRISKSLPKEPTK